MGCGRSTMGSDSPSRNSKQDEDWNEGSDTQTTQKDPPIPSASANSHQTLPFNHGGALLAQAKISGSQLDFFKVLDAKIESGPDYESDTEEGAVLKKSRLTLYLEQWNQLTRGKSVPVSQVQRNSENVPLIRPPTIQTSVETLDNECSPSSDENEAECDRKESVKEQYMFMGNLYTLTRFRSDGSYIPRVDVSPAHKPTDNDEEDIEIKKEATDTVTTALSVGSSSSDLVISERPVSPRSPNVMSGIKSDESVTRKVNGTEKVRKLQRADTPYHHTVTPRKEHIPQRPASLVLRTVFPKKEEAS